MSVTLKDVNGRDVIVAGSSIFLGSSNGGSTPFTEVGYASTAFIIICAALVFFMTPGLGMFYSGLSRTKNSLSLIMISMLSMSIITIQWVLFGFSLSFSETGGRFIGNFDMGGFKGLGASALPMTAPQIPGILFALYQMQFATITAALIFGSVAERIRLMPAMLFIFCWSTLVYNPVAYWSWSARGWLKSMSCLDTLMSDAPCAVGELDFAGGGPVHIASGFAGLAYCLMAGKRHRTGEPFKAHNMTNVFLGLALLWYGWYGFNAGSALSATPRAAMAGLVTTVSAAAGSLAWVLFDYSQHKKLSGLGFCSGAVAGLVGITPAAGYVAPWAAIIIGSVTGVVCNIACRVKTRLGFDDSLDAWGVHGVGGYVGGILTGIFAQKWIAALDGTVINGGWVDGNWVQVAYQLAGSTTIAVWSFVVSLLILFVINKIPGFHIRSTAEEQMLGNDLGEMGEVAYEIVVTSTNAPNHNTLSTAVRRAEKPELPAHDSTVSIATTNNV
ncbi:hypothetical protein PhCBS80983_g03194 [Powellomyces hirtus]|uniref:Ammonium transporter n=1 Tax=Powellomyces hirtus TaxID=109895 RepID=A0A507E5K2_9FUNG|nr:ammonium transporter AmtB-like domain-containing protein [Powellomyces hirtus]TPX58368.1 hypothetical protein PhCBS80983_g03194 [Powellomyces hirtus]